MSLKAALQADLAEKSMNLGDLADKLGITQQSVSKWIAKDEIPGDRLDQVLGVVGGQNSRTAQYIVHTTTERLRGAMGGKGASDMQMRFSRKQEPDPLPPVQAMLMTRPMHEAVTPTTRESIAQRWRGTEPWALLLPEHLRSAVHKAVELNGSIRRFDYLTDRTAISVRPQSNLDPTRVITAAIPLLLLKQRNPAMDVRLLIVPREVVGLPPSSYVEQDPTRKRIYENRRDIVRLDLLSLGVGVSELDTAEQVAALIESLETGELTKPIFSYEDYPDEEFVPPQASHTD